MEKIDLGYNPIGSYRKGNPFVTAFVHLPDKPSVLIVGGLNEVQIHIKRHYPISYTIKTFWRRGAKRSTFSPDILLPLPYEAICNRRHESEWIDHKLVNIDQSVHLWVYTKDYNEKVKTFLKHTYSKYPSGFPRVLTEFLKENQLLTS